MSLIRLFLVAVALFWTATSSAQTAAPFCLVSDSGQKSCFYYSLQACQQATLALGGMCAANSQAERPQSHPQAGISPTPQMGPLAGMDYVQQAGEQGRIRGEQQREARLRAELLEAQIARERAEAARASASPATGGTPLYRCVGADGIPNYSPRQLSSNCQLVTVYLEQPVLPPPRAIDQGQRYFHGYPCTQDCSGHEAGYEWAEEEGIEDEEDCTGWSQSFIEGCQAYVEENY
ncbi:hypothetical protein [Arenimonas aestuarii]